MRGPKFYEKGSTSRRVNRSGSIALFHNDVRTMDQCH